MNVQVNPYQNQIKTKKLQVLTTSEMGFNTERLVENLNKVCTSRLPDLIFFLSVMGDRLISGRIESEWKNGLRQAYESKGKATG